MNRLRLGLLVLLLLTQRAFPQTSSDPNEGSRLIPLGSNSYEFRWWAQPGKQ